MYEQYETQLTQTSAGGEAEAAVKGQKLVCPHQVKDSSDPVDKYIMSVWYGMHW